MVKKGDRRAASWEAAYCARLRAAGLEMRDPDNPGHFASAQVEIDALAALRPNVLAAITENVIAGAYYDTTPQRRASRAQSDWRTEAQAAIERQIDRADFGEVKGDADDALARLKEALADLKDCNDRLDELTQDIELPEAPAPREPEVDEPAQKPLADSDWGLVALAQALRARKAYDDVEDKGTDNE
jgi:hypothetical protein